MQPLKLLIYGEHPLTDRMKYVWDWIFGEQLQVSWNYTDNLNAYKTFKGIKLIYTSTYPKEYPGSPEIIIKPCGLLFNRGEIRDQTLAIQRWKQSTVLFYNQPGAAIPFDLFSAVFYLISRYEEYLPHEQDRHGRYKAEHSTAFRYRFLREPVVDQWIYHFRILLQKQFTVSLPVRPFEWEITFDVDMAWKYLHRGLTRKWAGLLKDLLRLRFKSLHERMQVLQGKRPDPYFSFPALEKIHKETGVQPIFFILLGKLSRYDRNNPPEGTAMQQLIKGLRKSYRTGLHPSYRSHQASDILKAEKDILTKICQEPVTRSRQHFIKFQLPGTYRKLIQSGIRKDYSMGYPSHSGFRAGTSHSFLWYDLEKEQSSSLRVFPFIFMDATICFHLGKTAEEARMEWEHFYHKLQHVHGRYISIWHNFILSGDTNHPSSWLQVYADLLKKFKSGKNPV